jgi:hypothetical protein
VVQFTVKPLSDRLEPNMGDKALQITKQNKKYNQNHSETVVESGGVMVEVSWVTGPPGFCCIAKSGDKKPWYYLANTTLF